MRKARIVLLIFTIFMVFTFPSCAKRSTTQTTLNISVTPTIGISMSDASEPAKASGAAAEDTDIATDTGITSETDIAADTGNTSETDIAADTGVTSDITPELDQVCLRTAQDNIDYYNKVEEEKEQLYSIENPDYIYYYDPFFSDLIYAVDKQKKRTLYYLNGDCIFIMTDDFIGPSYEAYKEEGNPIYENFEALIYDNSPEPFSKEISKLLPEQMDKILKEESIDLPINYYLLDYSTGDLNKDGQADAAVVIEQAPGFYTGSRAIYILVQDNGSYQTAYENKSIVLGQGDGGIFGDPYNGIVIENEVLHIYDYGGSAFRWSHDYEFTYQDNHLILSGAKEINYYTGTGNGTMDYYDLVRQTKETRTYSESEDSKGTPYRNLLLYSGALKLAGNIRFQDAYSWCIDDYITEPDNLCPDLGYYEYGLHDYDAAMQHTPEQILDQVKKKYYPDMKKVKLQLNKKILDNYRLLLGYSIPDYYYTDGVNVLHYYEYGEYGESGRYLHSIECYSVEDKWNNNQFIEFWDDTGKEKVAE